MKPVCSSLEGVCSLFWICLIYLHPSSLLEDHLYGGTAAVLFAILVLYKTVGSAHSLRIPFGIVSGPEALLGLTCLNCFSRPFCSILIGVMSVFVWILVFGRVLSVVLVKTDLNWSNRSSAFPLLSLIKFAPFFRGAIPPASSRFDFIYFQNGLVLLFLESLGQQHEN